MTEPRLPDRDAGQVDALVADHYLDALLEAGDCRAAGDGRPADALGETGLDGHAAVTALGAALTDPGLLDAARVLRRSLVRVHPSFRFEERLAARLADLAATQAAPALAAAGGSVIPFPGTARAAAGVAERVIETDPLLEAILRGELDPTDEAALDRAQPGAAVRRPLIVGGAAITSAAISIVGVAYVAWRATRPAARPSMRPSIRPVGRAAAALGGRAAVALAGADFLGPA